MNKSRKYEMSVGGKPIAYTLRRSKRARNLLLHVDSRGEVELVLPWRVPLREGERFVEYKQGWILQQIQKQRQRRLPIHTFPLTNGSRIPVFGGAYTLLVAIEPHRKKSFVDEDGPHLTIKAPNERIVREKVVQWYKRKAQQYFEGKILEFTVSSPVRIRINAAKTQWGSCNKKTRTLSFNWKLALMPEEISFYVLAHEVAHLTHANHSKSFWSLVEKLDPSYKEKQKWLRLKGHTLSLS